MEKIKNIKFIASKSSGEVSGIIYLPKNPIGFYVFAHGAGAPMYHPFMNNAAEYLAEERIGTLRYNFPYSEKKKKYIDPAPILMETVRSAINSAKEYIGDIPLFAGGKSMGGRMTSQAAAKEMLDDVKGLIFYGFPLHAPGKDSTERGEHLYKIEIPMLFLQGTRDKLANLELLKPIIKKVGKNANLQIIEGADHSFKVLKSLGRTEEQIQRDLAHKIRQWIEKNI